MATILTKKKDTTGAPSAGDLTNSTGGAELAVNTADKRLYTKDSGGNVVEVGINPTSITTGTLNTSGAVVFNDAGADVDFRVEGDTNANLLFVDASADKVGIGTNAPDSTLTVQGNPPEIKLFTTDTTAAEAGAIYWAASTTGDTRVKLEHDESNNVFRTSVRSVSTDSWIDAITIPRTTGNVGIGTSSPASKLDLEVSTGAVALQMGSSGAGGADWRLQTGDTSSGLNGSLRFYDVTSTAERMRIDSSGNLLVGTTSSIVSDGSGIALQADGRFISRYTDASTFDRRSTDGTIIDFQKDGTTVGSIEIQSHGFEINGEASHAGISFATVAWVPKQNGSRIDNVIDLGALSYRFDDVYATNGTIQTSDRNEKQDIEALSEAEARVAVAAKGLLKKYRWKSAVAEKGDDARIHFGIIAQDLKAAFEAEGLDAGRYAMFIHSEWWETQTEVPAVEAKEAVYETHTDEEGNETQVLVSEAVEGKEAYTRTDTYETEEEAPEGAVRKERMGIRYNELLAFIIAAI